MSADGGKTVEYFNDVQNELVVLGAALVDRAARKKLARTFSTPDYFLTPENARAWDLVLELERRGLDYDEATARRVSPDVDHRLLAELVEARPDAPANLDFHVAELLWDRTKATALAGPLNGLLEALRDPKADRARIDALARQVPAVLARGGARLVRDARELQRDVLSMLDSRFAGRAVYPFGLDALDYFDSDEEAREAGFEVDEGEERVRRIVPGAAPAMITLISAMTKVGKALSLDTPIPTPDGWTTMGAIQVGDVVFDERGERCSVTGCSRVMRNHDCFEVEFADGSKIVADADHLWWTRTAAERMAAKARTSAGRAKMRKWRGAKQRRRETSKTMIAMNEGRGLSVDGEVRTTRQIAESLVDPRCPGSRPRMNHTVDVAGPLVLPKRSLPIPPYVLGAWLGDGTSEGGGFTCDLKDRQIVDEISDEGIVIEKRKQKHGWYMYGIRARLRELGVLYRKHIPEVYLRASIPQRLALLQGLMDTDGYCTKKGACNFDTMRWELLDGVRELLASLGIKSNFSAKQATIDGRDVGTSWRLEFVTSLRVFRLERKVARQRDPKIGQTTGRDKRRTIVAVRPVPSVPVRCIRVDSPSSLYLAGEQMIPTHNTTFLGSLILGIARQNRRVLVASWEIGSKMSLEFLTELSLVMGSEKEDPDPRFSRSRMLRGAVDWTDEMREKFSKRAKGIAKYVVFMDNPFYRRTSTKRATNEQHIDLFGAAIAESGAEVVVADLWSRMLTRKSPEDEETALFQQLAQVEELGVHLFMVTQQKHKEILLRADKRPTAEGIKGSGAYAECATLMLGLHRPALFKKIEDNRIEVYCFDQRWAPGRWAVAVEFDPKTGVLGKGKSIPYDPGFADDDSEMTDPLLGRRKKKGK